MDICFYKTNRPEVKRITEILVNHFGHQSLGNKENPLDELLFIILSSKTPPTRYEEAYKALRNAYPDLNDLADADWTKISGIISCAGLQNRKAKAMVTIAKRLRDEFGTVSLSLLSELSNDEAESFLRSFPEVSKKSARCVLMYSLGRQFFPVDTHCFRISKRLGWVSGDAQLTESCTDELQDSIPPNLRRDLHVGMILLGRHYCKPRNPDCEHCPILEFCITGKKSSR
jgi:endonuclease III